MKALLSSLLLLSSSTRGAPPPDVPYAWRNVRIDGGGFVPAVLFSRLERGLVYARTDMGGAYRLDAPTQRWLPLLDSLDELNQTYEGTLALAVHPARPGALALACGLYYGSAPSGAVLVSEDYGASWATTPLPGVHLGGNEDGRNAGERLAFDPNAPATLWLGTSQDGLWTSADGGRSFVRSAAFAPSSVTFVLFDGSSGAPGAATPVVHVGTSDGGGANGSVWTTRDGGRTFAQPGGTQPAGMTAMRAALDTAGTLFVTFGDALGPNGMSRGAVARLARGAGAAWEVVTPPAAGGGGFCGVAVDPVEAGVVVVTTLDWWAPDEIFRSTDGGRSWAALGAKALTSSPAAWVYWHRPSPSWTGWMSDIAIDPFNGSIATHTTGQGIWRTENLAAADQGAPTAWAFFNVGLEETVPLDLVAPPAGPVVLLSALGDIDGFPHEDLTASPPGGMFSPARGNTQGLDVAFLNVSIVVRTTSTGSPPASISRDGGFSFEDLASAPPGGGRAGPIAIAADASAVLWSGFVTRDAGATWAPCSGLPPRTSAIADRVTPSAFYAVVGGDAIYSSADGGRTFSKGAPAPQGAGALRADPFVSGTIWVPASSGLFRSVDGGATLQQVGAGVVTAAVSVALGAPQQAGGPAAAYLYGDAGGVRGAFFRSVDSGASWARINDARTQFGYVMFLHADPRVFGRVFLGTNGRGIPYGEPA
jgi:hypothetical protein